METEKKEKVGYIIQLEIDRQKWIQFKKEVNQKKYKRAVINVEKDTKTVQASNFTTYILTTQKGVVRMSLNKATNPPKIGSVIEFKISPYKNSYEKFYISEIIKEIPNAGDCYLYQLYEYELYKR